MKYNNAKDLLPEWLLSQVQIYIQGEVLYIPKRICKTKMGRS